MAAIAPAQSVLTTQYSGTYFLASLTGGVYFDLAVQHDLHLDRLDLHLASPANTSGTVEVFVRSGTWDGHIGSQGDWVLAATGPVVAAGPNQASPCQLSTPIGLPAGTFGVAVHCIGVMPAYTFAFAPRTIANADLALTGGGSALWFLQSAPYLYRVFDGALHYTNGGGPYLAATVQAIGTGCVQGARAFYERFAPGAFDLTNTRFHLVPNGNGGYDVTRLPGTPIALPTGAQNLNLVRGGAAFVDPIVPFVFPGGSTARVLAIADGRILLTSQGLLGSATAVPSWATLCTDPPVLAVAWQDLAPNGAANVYTSFDQITAATTVTWWNVPVQGQPGVTCTMAATLFLDGSVDYAIGACANPTLPALVGFGPGAGARDPGSRDLSAVTVFATQHDDDGLGLVADGRPVLGTTTTLRLVDTPASATACMFVLGLGPLGVPLDLAAFGAPGCEVHVLAPAAVAWSSVAQPAIGLQVPSAAALLGVQGSAQGAAFAPGRNALGLAVSNALVWTVGGV